MERKLAHFLSYLFHPFWMPSFMVLILYWITLNGAVRFQSAVWYFIIIIVLVNTIIIPILLIWLMKRLKMIESLSLSNKKDRLYPFLITALFYFTTWFVFRSLNIIPFLSSIFIIATVLVLLAAIINVLWKISIHNMSMGAISAAIVFLTASHYIASSWPAYIILLLSGLVGFARLKLRAHTPAQVYGGFIVGVCVFAIFAIRGI